MKTVIIFDHPYTLTASDNQPHFRSYSAALAKATINRLKEMDQEVDVIDLHADHFDPVMHQNDLSNWRKEQSINSQVDQYFERLSSADHLIFIFPIWWKVMPAMTKGFIDKVFSKNRLVSAHPRIVLPKNPTIKFFTVSGTPTILYRLKYGNPIEKALSRGTFKKLGLKKVNWYNFNAEDQSAAKREKALKTIGKYL